LYESSVSDDSKNFDNNEVLNPSEAKISPVYELTT